MKKAIYLLGIALSLQFVAGAQKYSFENLMGTWRNKEGAGLEVVDSSRIYIVYGQHKKLISSYRTDFSTNPARFNFVVHDSSGTTNVKSLLLFVNDDLLQWQVFDSETRPVKYNTDRGDLLILRKIEEQAN
ncbi:MAG: hypothetical protein ACM3VS_10395 [Candidatus Dadabacteria bacterium]